MAQLQVFDIGFTKIQRRPLTFEGPFSPICPWLSSYVARKDKVLMYLFPAGDAHFKYGASIGEWTSAWLDRFFSTLCKDLLLGLATHGQIMSCGPPIDFAPPPYTHDDLDRLLSVPTLPDQLAQDESRPRLDLTMADDSGLRGRS